MPTRAARYYSLAGALVGTLSAVVLLAANWLGSPAVAAILAIGAGAIITGGFHEDGLADTADGLGGGNTAQARLKIMKDSRIGTYGALALGLVTLLRIAALTAIPPRHAAYSLLLAHTLARALPVALMVLLPYAGDPSAAKLPHQDMRVTAGEFGVCLMLSLGPIAFLPSMSAVFATALAALAALCVARLSLQLIGGFTGDVLGAIEQMSEAAILVGIGWGLHI